VPLCFKHGFTAAFAVGFLIVGAAAQSPGVEPSNDTVQPDGESQTDRAERELQQLTKQRILGVIPNFNTSFIQDAAPLTAGQKTRLALRGALDPFMFVSAGIDAAMSQRSNSFKGYGQGAEGYAKRVGAAYADDFSGTIFGGVVFPVLLHQDPRYFRRGFGSFGGRLFYAISTTLKAKNDKGHWGPNYSNVLGNLAAGAVSNLYYPSTDRGVSLTLQRALTVTAEGAIGSIFVEFWPDISAKLFHHHDPERTGHSTPPPVTPSSLVSDHSLE
jgi:hypothetical protein